MPNTPKERPILFSTQMVQAILDGRKSMTRRIVKPQYEIIQQTEYGLRGGRFLDPATRKITGSMDEIRCPYGTIGDRLWVRETFQHSKILNLHPTDENYGYIYRASENGAEFEKNYEEWKWKPSIFMPRLASRITLEIVNVRVERLQEITNNDIRSEGACNITSVTHRLDFQQLWGSINGKESWDENPWVWVVEFKKV